MQKKCFDKVQKLFMKIDKKKPSVESGERVNLPQHRSSHMALVVKNLPVI